MFKCFDTIDIIKDTDKLKIEAIGSTAMGTSLKDSDLDLVVVISEKFLDAGKMSRDELAHKIFRCLKENGISFFFCDFFLVAYFVGGKLHLKF